MPARPLTEEEKREIRVIYNRILEAAMAYHKRSKVHGIQGLIADDAGLTTSAAVSKWAKTLSKPSDSALRKLADRYGVSTTWLSGLDDEPEAITQAYSSADIREMRDAAIDIVERVLKRLDPHPEMKFVLKYTGRAMDLLEEGKDKDHAFGIVFHEAEREIEDTKQ